jgi:hypothetical protein
MPFPNSKNFASFISKIGRNWENTYAEFRDAVGALPETGA